MEEMPEAEAAEEVSTGAREQLLELLTAALGLETEDDIRGYLAENTTVEDVLASLTKAPAEAPAEPMEMAASRDALRGEVRELSRQVKELTASNKALQAERDTQRVCSDFGLSPAEDAERVARLVSLSRSSAEDYAFLKAERGADAGKPPRGREVAMSRTADDKLTRFMRTHSEQIDSLQRMAPSQPRETLARNLMKQMEAN